MELNCKIKLNVQIFQIRSKRLFMIVLDSPSLLTSGIGLIDVFVITTLFLNQRNVAGGILIPVVHVRLDRVSNGAMAVSLDQVKLILVGSSVIQKRRITLQNVMPS